MKRVNTFVRIIVIAFLLILVSLPAISWAEAPDGVTIKRAICVPSNGKWRIMGRAVPGDVITVSLNGSEIGNSAVIANGRWAVVVDHSAVVAITGDSVTAISTSGGTATQVVEIR